ncbi:MAG: hypothetical protein R3330_20235, partial [Saprospiraceae bacterium]|nr:hypothetical protein [Saprospiraceae bacterium]
AGGGPAAATMHSVTTSIDLVEFDCAIFVGLDYVPSRLLQAEARVHRTGQRRGVTIYYLIGAGTIDEVIQDRVISRLETFAQLTDGAEGDQAELAQHLRGATDDELIAQIVAQVKGE